ncbi:MAG: hypothetical protein ACTSXG_00555 [Alphaproteobacteria bacterium]
MDLISSGKSPNEAASTYKIGRATVYSQSLMK